MGWNKHRERLHEAAFSSVKAISNKKDLHLYLRSIERSIIKSCIQYGVQASTKEGLTGVWCNDRKMASIGVGVRQWVSMHGFAINVNGDLSPFNEITPCGIQNAEMTNMETMHG